MIKNIYINQEEKQSSEIAYMRTQIEKIKPRIRKEAKFTMRERINYINKRKKVFI